MKYVRYIQRIQIHTVHHTAVKELTYSPIQLLMNCAAAENDVIDGSMNWIMATIVWVVRWELFSSVSLEFSWFSMKTLKFYIFLIVIRDFRSISTLSMCFYIYKGVFWYFSSIFPNFPEFSWIFLNFPEFSGIFLNFCDFL